jgi:nucleotide-binding universal stress UspA family protein
MGKGHFDHAVVPVASEEDARTTATAIRTYLTVETLTVVYVVEKAGGGLDKASVEQRERTGIDAFAAFRETFDGDVTVETEVVYDTDIAEGLVDAAAEVGADAVAFTPRGGGWFERVLAGDVTRDLLDVADRPVVVLPAVEQ